MVKKKKKNIPGLRFSRFENAWEESILDNISERCTDKNIGMKYVDVLTNSAIQGVVRQNDYFDKAIANQNNLGGYYIVDKDCFVYNPRISVSAPVGPIKRNHLETGIMSPLYTVFKLKNVNLDFIEFYFETIFWHNYMKSIANYGARHDRMNITNSDLFRMPLFLPSLPEQEKIASFLSAVDERIQQLSKKKSLLEQYKKGVMQQIFSQKLRFKDDKGNNFPDWVAKKIGEIAIKKSSQISANGIEENCGEFIIYGASGILKKIDFYEEEEDYVSIVKDGAGVGRLLYCKGKSSVLGTMDIIKPISQKINTFFLYYILNNIDFIKYITGSTIPHIYFKDYSNENCKVPSLPEQEKIASFLSSIDKKIKLVNTQLEKTKSWKKGLLQKMFV